MNMAITDKEVRIFIPLMLFFASLMFLAFLAGNVHIKGISGMAVTIIAPAQNGNLKGTVTFTATAAPSDNIASMSFLYNNTVFTSVQNTTSQQTIFEKSFDISGIPDNKNYNITAIGYDSLGTEVSRSSALGITIDNTAPVMQYNSPTPENGATLIGNLSIDVSASDSVSGLDSIVIYINDIVNKTCTSSPCTLSFNSTGSYSFSAKANDTLGNSNTVQTRTISFSAPVVDTTAPVINSTINSEVVVAGKNVVLNAIATDNVAVSSIWAVITCSNSSVQNIPMPNGNANFNASAIGTYNIIFYANDTSGNNASRTGSFITKAGVNLNISVVSYSQTGIVSSAVLYIPNTDKQLASLSLLSGRSITEVANYTYDILFEAYDKTIGITLKNVDISLNLNKIIGIDRLPIPAAGYEKTYAINNNYVTSLAKIKINYGTYFPDENSLIVYKCDNWNFANRTCSGNFGKLTTGVTQLKDEHSFIIETASFSAFSIRQESFCGDNICNGNETNATCPADCSGISFETSACSEGNITSVCLCGNVSHSSGYCCNNIYQATSCISACSEGAITSECLCGGASYSVGYCCSSVFQAGECAAAQSEQLATGEETGEKKKFDVFPILLGVLILLIVGTIAAFVIYFIKSRPKIEAKPVKPSQSLLVQSMQRMPAQAAQKQAAATIAMQKPTLAFTPEKVREIMEKRKENEGEKRKRILEELKKISEEK